MGDNDGRAEVSNAWYGAGIALDLIVITESISIATVGVHGSLRVANFAAFSTLPVLVAAIVRNQRRALPTVAKPKLDSPARIRGFLLPVLALLGGVLLCGGALADHILGWAGWITWIIGILAAGLALAVERHRSEKLDDPANEAHHHQASTLT